MADEKEKKKPKLLSLSVMKDAVFTDEALATYTIGFLSFPDVIKLLETRPSLLRNPLLPNNKLSLFWDILLTYHYFQFIHANLLARLKNRFKWNNQIVQTIVQKLRENIQKPSDPLDTKLPWFFIPDSFFFGDEELLYIYSMIALYVFKYDVNILDLYGRGLSIFRAGIPYVQIDIHPENYIVRTRESEETFTDKYELIQKLYRFMQEGFFVIHVILPTDQEFVNLQKSVTIDNWFAGSKYTFSYVKNPNQITIRKNM